MEEVPAFIVKGALAFSDAPTVVRASVTCTAWRQHAEDKELWAFLLSLRPTPALVPQNAALPRRRFVKIVQEERSCLDYLKVCTFGMVKQLSRCLPSWCMHTLLHFASCRHAPRNLIDILLASGFCSFICAQRIGTNGDYTGDILAEARQNLKARYCLQLLWFVHQYYDSQTVSFGADVQQCRDDLIAYMGQLFPSELVLVVCNELHVQFAANKLYATMQARVSSSMIMRAIVKGIYSRLRCISFEFERHAHAQSDSMTTAAQLSSICVSIAAMRTQHAHITAETQYINLAMCCSCSTGHGTSMAEATITACSIS
jgi:hypothetical protein